MNPLLKQISDHAAEDLQSLIESGETDILNAIHKMEEEAQLQESKPKFALGFKITVDLDKSTFDCSLAWSVKQSLSVSHQIEDVNQEKLPLKDSIKSVTISSGSTSVTLDGSAAHILKKAAAEMSKKK